jgi:drug/metabolite transporter (DMT)-like permease
MRDVAGMSPPVMFAVLLAALLHAGWNVAVRAAEDRRRETALLLCGGTVIAVATLPFLGAPEPASWPYLLASALLNGLYFILISETYARGSLSLAYPLMRGVAPMLTLMAAWLLLGELLPIADWLGIATICAGVLLLVRRRGDAAEATSIRFALANAVVIATYTLNDAVGARLSQAPVSYTLCLFPLSAIPTLLWLLHRSTALHLPDLREAARGLGGAGASVGAYALVLWAMTQAAVAPVAALREIGILIGVVLARLFLGERPGRRGWGGAMTIAAGAVILRLAR